MSSLGMASDDGDVWPKVYLAPSNLRVLRIESLSFTSLTIASCLLYFYWFLRIEWKNFRQQLIALLIMSDFFRTVLTFAFPLVTWTFGDDQQDTPYCSASGFLTNFFFVQSDYIILIMAMHTAMFIYKPTITLKSSQGGLWPWRWWVYGGFIVLPTIISSLAFINTSGAYVPLSIWCWLPAKPLWWRMFLSWVPRYVTFLVVIITYISLIYSVHRTYKVLGRNLQTTGSSDESETPARAATATAATSELDYFPPGWTGGARQQSVVTFDESLQRLGGDTSRRGTLASIGLHRHHQQQHVTAASPAPSSAVDAPPDGAANSYFGVLPVSVPPPTQFLLQSSSPDTQTPLSPTDQSPMPTITTPSSSQIQESAIQFERRRAKVLRQMRALLLYPIFYILVWQIPFALHITLLATSEISYGIWILYNLSAIMFAIQGFLNVCIFAIKEKPWKQVSSSTKIDCPRTLFLAWRKKRRERKAAAAATAATGPDYNAMECGASNSSDSQTRNGSGREKGCSMSESDSVTDLNAGRKNQVSTEKSWYDFEKLAVVDSNDS